MITMSPPAGRETQPDLGDDEDDEPVRPPPRPRLERGAAWRVDRAAPRLARLCAGWAHRGRPVEDLVGLVPGCRCSPVVMPRTSVEARLDPGPTRDALLGVRPVAGRLAVVETTSSARGNERPLGYAEHHISVPPVDTPDTRGCLERLSWERGALLFSCLEESVQQLSPTRTLAKLLFDHHTPDALYMEAALLELGGSFSIRERSYATPAERRFLDAADYQAQPGKLLCLMNLGMWERAAVEWVGLDELGLSFAGDPCDDWDKGRLLEIFTAPRNDGPPGEGISGLVPTSG